MKAIEKKRMDEILKNSSKLEAWKKDLLKATLNWALSIFHEVGEDEFVSKFKKKDKNSQAIMKFIQYVATGKPTPKFKAAK